MRTALACVMFIHFVGRGDEVELAKGLREALALTKSPLGTTPAAPETKPEIATEIERMIGYQGTMGGDVFHITVPRNDLDVASMGTMIPGSMGMNTPFNFQLDGKNAAINGTRIPLNVMGLTIEVASRSCEADDLN